MQQWRGIAFDGLRKWTKATHTGSDMALPFSDFGTTDRRAFEPMNPAFGDAMIVINGLPDDLMQFILPGFAKVTQRMQQR